MARLPAMSMPVVRAASAILLAWTVPDAAWTQTQTHAQTHVLASIHVHAPGQSGLPDPLPRVWMATLERPRAPVPSPPGAGLLAAADHPQGLSSRRAPSAHDSRDARFSGEESDRDELQGAGVSWESLSEEQRELLSKYQAHWDQLPMGRQRALARGAHRWLTLPPERREQAQRRFEHWQSLDSKQRRELRRRYQEFKVLPAQEQERIRRGFQNFQHLAPEQRRELRKRFHDLPPEERRRLKEHRQPAWEAGHDIHPPGEPADQESQDHSRRRPQQGDSPPE
ncbi:hypothetical protein ACG33_00605 [Steroidobacter denitrificans]|uniref:DUF3106 domain-containing protein n=1 Tax=Steroidobacter denitrificans TaxID=465721 RepID=A0A127F5C8_STEDE|nr:DUF3106 domain-containing protein [Steroidobacter denitrificans]AMN45627.1 hypothetical protein ACG33_00605 [Steroidobacter denitrificans]